MGSEMCIRDRTASDLTHLHAGNNEQDRRLAPLTFSAFPLASLSANKTIPVSSIYNQHGSHIHHKSNECATCHNCTRRAACLNPNKYPNQTGHSGRGMKVSRQDRLSAAVWISWRFDVQHQKTLAFTPFCLQLNESRVRPTRREQFLMAARLNNLAVFEIINSIR